MGVNKSKARKYLQMVMEGDKPLDAAEKDQLLFEFATENTPKTEE